MRDCQLSGIHAYLPHRGLMCLLDRLIEVDVEHAVSEVDTPSSGLFVSDGKVPAWVGVEYMAQTVAAWTGNRARLRGGRPRVGFLLGTRRYSTECSWFDSGKTLRIEARCEFISDNGLGMFDCRILLGADILATARISVFEPLDRTQSGEGSI